MWGCKSEPKCHHIQLSSCRLWAQKLCFLWSHLGKTFTDRCRPHYRSGLWPLVSTAVNLLGILTRIWLSTQVVRATLGEHQHCMCKHPVGRHEPGALPQLQGDWSRDISKWNKWRSLSLSWARQEKAGVLRTEKGISHDEVMRTGEIPGQRSVALMKPRAKGIPFCQPNVKLSFKGYISIPTIMTKPPRPYTPQYTILDI